MAHEPTLQAQLQALLQALLAELSPDGGQVQRLRKLSGGASQDSWAFDWASTDGVVQPLVLRRTPPGATVRSGGSAGLDAEAALIALADEAGVPVPPLVLRLRAEHGLGQGFVMGHLDGETLGRRIVSNARFALARQGLARRCGQVLAQIHALPRARLPALREATAAGELAHCREWHRSHGMARPVFALALRWLADQCPDDGVPLGLVHGDFRTGNLMVDEAGLVGVLDWELAHVGDAMQDLGWLCVNSWRYGRAELPVGGFGTRDELFAGYADGGGTVDAARVQWWQVFGTLHWGVICESMGQAGAADGQPQMEKSAIGRRASEAEIDLLQLLAPR